MKVVAYTSLLRADSSDLVLAAEHKATEDYLKDSGVNFILLRNGWYFENHTAALKAALQNERSSAAPVTGVSPQHPVPTTQGQLSSC